MLSTVVGGVAVAGTVNRLVVLRVEWSRVLPREDGGPVFHTRGLAGLAGWAKRCVHLLLHSALYGLVTDGVVISSVVCLRAVSGLLFLRV